MQNVKRQAERPVKVDAHAVLGLVLSLFAWVPLLSSSYFMNAHDAPHSLFFPLQFAQGIRDGYWLPRWAADVAHGYGYPLLVFYAPLSFYIWEGFYATGLFGVVASTKVTFGVGFIVAAAGMYAYARDLWGRRAGLLACVVYTYLPYHLLNIYVRAALAEFTAMSLLPWIALAFRRLIHRPSLPAMAGAAASFGALLWTHNITALLFTPMLGALILFELAQPSASWPKWNAPLTPGLLTRLVAVGGSSALGVALGTAIWFPGLTEQNAIRIEQWALQTYQYKDHFVYPSQFLSSAWDFGYSVPGIQDAMSFQLGTPALMLALMGLAHLWMTRTHTPDSSPSSLASLYVNRGFIVFYGISLLILVALMLPPAIVVWDLSPLSTLIQFPWRLLGLAGFCLALVASSAVGLIATDPTGLPPPPGLVLAVLVILWTSSGYTQPQMTPPNPRNETQQIWRDYEKKYPDMVGMVAQTQVQPTDSPMLAALEANQTPQRFETDTPGVTIRQLYVGGGSARARIEASRPATIRYLTYWYPGWSATLNGQPIPIRQESGPLGLMVVEVPAGIHTLAFRFGDPPKRQAANTVSLVSLAIVLGLLGVGAWRRGQAV